MIRDIIYFSDYFYCSVTSCKPVLTNSIKLVMSKKISDVFFFMILFMMLISCRKNNDMNPGPGVTPAFKLSYGDSIFYLSNKEQSLCGRNGRE